MTKTFEYTDETGKKVEVVTGKFLAQVALELSRYIALHNETMMKLEIKGDTRGFLTPHLLRVLAVHIANEEDDDIS